MRRALHLMVALILTLSIASHAEAQEPKKAQFAELLSRAREADPGLDFTALRMAYAESDLYSPYGGDRSVFEKALREKDYAEAIRLGEERLKEDFLDVWAHWAVWQAANELGDQKRMDLHVYMLRGILQSIRDSGDGKSTETAFKVISTAETYFVLTVMGYRPKSQALQGKDGHSFDAMTVVDSESGAEVTLFFNVDISMNHMKRLLSPAKKPS